MSAITTHVLDTATGRPAAGIHVVLHYQEPQGWKAVGVGITDADGRVQTLLPDDYPLAAGTYSLIFNTDQYSAFYRKVQVEFTIQDTTRKYHLPLLLSPFGYSTYRGS
jgi:5-hydroxyisourate hydrolase